MKASEVCLEDQIYRIEGVITRYPLLYAIFVFLIGTVLTLIVWRSNADSVEASARSRFSANAQQVASLLDRRMLAHEQILRGGRALFEANDRVTRAQWHDYVDALRLDDHFPGILGVGFTLRIRPEEKDAITASIRREGFPSFAIHPENKRSEYHSIIYLEPFWGRNLRAFGYDMMTEPTRRIALVRARDTGMAALSGRVVLVQETKQDVQPGFLLYLPVYRKGAPRTTLEERRESLLGYVYSPFRARDLLDSVLAPHKADTQISIYDGHQAGNENHLIYSSSASQRLDAPQFSTVKTIEVAGNAWTIKLDSTTSFESSVGVQNVNMQLVAGMIVTSLITLTVLLLAHTRNRASRLASKMSRQYSESEGRLKAVLDSAADGILTINAKGEVETINQSACRIFDVDPETFSGKPLSAVIPGLDVDHLRDVLWRARGQGGLAHSAYVDTLGLRADGREFPVSISVGQIDVGSDLRYSLIVRDVTESQEAESVLHLRQRVIESSSSGIVISDMSTEEQAVIYVNPACTEITGYSAEEFMGRNCRFLLGEDLDQPAREELRHAIENRLATKVLLRNYRKNGNLFWNELTISPVFDETGTLTHYVGIQNDVTERVLAQGAAELRTHRLDTVFTLSPDGFVVFDVAGLVSDVNPAFLRMTGLESERIIGRPMHALDEMLQRQCDPDQPFASLVASSEAEHLPGEPSERRTAIRHTLHLTIPENRIIQYSIQEEHRLNGEHVAYFRDITRESEVDRLKSEFLSTAAHELRTPMASIFGFSDLLMRREYDEPKRKELISTINRQAGILINLINELLDLARIEARAGKDFKYRKVMLGPVVENAVAALMMNSDPRQVVVDLPTLLPEVRIDEEKFSQALTNVLSNAYKYSPAGGRIALSTATGDIDGRYAIGIRVCDQGMGMKPEHLERLFERFFRADPSGNIPGTGLGMCIVKEIMEIHGGRVSVESEFGEGTTVTLWLPID